jgi:hypothetical protein
MGGETCVSDIVEKIKHIAMLVLTNASYVKKITVDVWEIEAFKLVISYYYHCDSRSLKN